MRPVFNHSWTLSTREAAALQRDLASRVERVDRFSAVQRVAGIDVGYENAGQITRAAVAVLEFPSLTPLAQVVARRPTSFPYVPGLLSFREVPSVLDALEQLTVTPDLILCDGQGLAHPRRFGLACHLGVLLDCPSIGVAKSRLVGTHDPVPMERGAWTPLRDGEDVIGAVLRSRAGIAPLYVSIGHRISLTSAVQWVMACTTRYRLPETTRAAHHLASAKG